MIHLSGIFQPLQAHSPADFPFLSSLSFGSELLVGSQHIHKTLSCASTKMYPWLLPPPFGHGALAESRVVSLTWLVCEVEGLVNKGSLRSLHTPSQPVIFSFPVVLGGGGYFQSRRLTCFVCKGGGEYNRMTIIGFCGGLMEPGR